MGFQLDAYKAQVAPVRIDDIDFREFRLQPLSPEALRSLHYMSDIETWRSTVRKPVTTAYAGSARARD